LEDEPEFRIRISSGGTSGVLEAIPRTRGRAHRLTLRPPETTDVTNKDVEGLLKGLLLAFEKATTQHYCVKKAKTSIVTTRNAEGKLGISLGMNIFKIFDASGNVKGERTEGIEIEIERIEKSS
jgi:hypothetical protein